MWDSLSHSNCIFDAFQRCSLQKPFMSVSKVSDSKRLRSGAIGFNRDALKQQLTHAIAADANMHWPAFEQASLYGMITSDD